MPTTETLTVQQLKLALHYDPETGVFIHRGSSRRWLGKVAGTRRKDGYVLIGVLGVRHLAHRLAWLYMTGRPPEFEIDHKDTRRANNCFANLRSADRPANMHNTSLRKTNTSGFKGVTFHRPANKWHARIGVRGVVHSLGYFSNASAAGEAYNKASKKYHAAFSRV